jgi:hypothetical protein
MNQDRELEVKPGDWVFIVSKKNGEVFGGRRVQYVGEIENFFLVKVPVVMGQGLKWVVSSFDKEEWSLVKGPE